MPAEPTPPPARPEPAWVRPEEQLARWGRQQHRQVTTQQLHAVGWCDSVIHDRVRQGRLHPVFAQVYSLGGPPQSDRERWMASALTFGRGTRLSDATAVELYGWLRYPLGELHVTTTTERAPRDGITPHHRAGSTDWRLVDRIPVTSPEQTVLDCAATLRDDRLFRRVVRQAQAERASSHVRLLLTAARSAGVRGVARLRAELADGPRPTRSANEDRVLELLTDSGPILINHVIDGDEVDLYLPERRTAIEVDSPLHDNPAARRHDAAKQARLERRGITVRRIV